MKTRMKVASCVCAMALMAGASTAWGYGMTASATIDFWNVIPTAVGEPSGNQVVSTGAIINSVNTVVKASSFNGVPSALAPVSATGIIGTSNATASLDALDPSASYYTSSHVVNATSAAGLPVNTSDNVDWFAVAMNTTNKVSNASGTVAFQFLFDVIAAGDTVTITANTIDNMLADTDPGNKVDAVFRYLFTVTDLAGVDLDPLGQVLVTRTYNTAGILAVNGLDQLFQYTYTTPGTLAAGTYYLLAEAQLDQSSAVPEPGTFILAGSGLLGLFLLRRRISKQG